MRVLVTGDRNYTHRSLVWGILSACSARSETVTVVEGQCPYGGADEFAYEWAEENGIPERHPADWNTHGKKAGFPRNQEMVDLGADVCFAFKDGFDFTFSKGGTEHCASRAKAAGIPTYVISKL